MATIYGMLINKIDRFFKDGLNPYYVNQYIESLIGSDINKQNYDLVDFVNVWNQYLNDTMKEHLKLMYSDYDIDLNETEEEKQDIVDTTWIEIQTKIQGEWWDKFLNSDYTLYNIRKVEVSQL